MKLVIIIYEKKKVLRYSATVCKISAPEIPSHIYPLHSGFPNSQYGL